MQLIGREAPLRVLRAALTRGTGAVLVRGEPGIGKTSLVDALAREAAARGHTVLAGRTDPDDGAPPLWPWLQALTRSTICRVSDRTETISQITQISRAIRSQKLMPNSRGRKRLSW